MFFNAFPEEWANILLHYCTVHVCVLTAAQAAPFFVCSSVFKSVLQHVQEARSEDVNGSLGAVGVDLR